MEITSTTLKAKIRSLDMRETPGEIQIRFLSNQERVVTALKRLGIFWAIALVCVAIPMLHFILVPLFFLIGIVAFIVTYLQTRKIEKLSGSCPSCGKQVQLENLRYSVELKEHCPACRNALYVSFEKL